LSSSNIISTGRSKRIDTQSKLLLMLLYQCPKLMLKLT
jgi:hypothetical protein